MKKYFSPGRVNLIGEHIDYNGGNVLPVAINFGTYGDVKLIDEPVIRLSSKNFENDGVHEYHLNDDVLHTSKWFDYPLGVISVLKKRGYKLVQGFEMVVEGNIPNQSGLSSSASLEVLMAYVLSDLNNLSISRKDIAIICKEAENDFVGVNCGIMDQFIIANGQKDKALNLNCQTLNYDVVDCDLGEYQLVVLNSNVKRTLVDSAYNQRAAECAHALSCAKQMYSVDELCQLNINQIGALESELDSVTFKRLRHVVSEQDRVIKSVAALNAKDIALFGQHMYASHASLRDDYEVSCLELDLLVSTASELNAVGARMTGAGFGGCAIALVSKHEVAHFVEEIAKVYLDNTGIVLDCFVVDVEDGVNARV